MIGSSKSAGDKSTPDLEVRPVRSLFSMTGADPNTAWLAGCVAMDDKGFIRPAPTCAPTRPSQRWPLARAPI